MSDNLLKWKKAKVFNLVYWYAGHNEHTTRFIFEIEKTSEEYPYRLSMYSNYKGDFRTIAAAKEQAETELRLALRDLKAGGSLK
jgi:hypothetical protein